MAEPQLIAKNASTGLYLLPALANRHGLITGATGTGKTVTLQVMAERFSAIGVPVFMADVKGDLSGITQPGAASPKFAERLQARSASTSPSSRAARPCSGTSSASRAIRSARPSPTWARCCSPGSSTSTRSSRACSTLVFKIADDNGLLLLDLKDLRAMLQHVGDNARTFQTDYGNVSAASHRRDPARAARRSSSRARDRFFGEPMLNLDDLLQTDAGGRGHRQHPGRRQADAGAEALLDVPALAAVRALREPARGRRSRQAEARLLLRRGAPAVHRRAEVAAGQDRAGRAPDPLQGRRRLLRDPEPARHPGHRAGPARQPRPARAARLHAARPEGGEGGGRDVARQSRSSTPRRPSPSSASARRWSRSSTRRDGRRSSSAPTSCRRRAASVPRRPTSGRGARGVAGGRGLRADRRSRVGVRAAQGTDRGRAAPPRDSRRARPPQPAAAGWTRSRTRSAA